jgi:hypothetical protein
LNIGLAYTVEIRLAGTVTIKFNKILVKMYLTRLTKKIVSSPLIPHTACTLLPPHRKRKLSISNNIL